VRSGSGRSVRRAWPLHFYLSVLVVLFIAAASAGAVFGGQQAEHDARLAAEVDASFWARAAAKETADEVALVQQQVDTTAASPGIDQLFVSSEGCTLTFGGPGGAEGHIDIVSADGSVVCTSLASSDAAPTSEVYAGDDWLARSLEDSQLLAPIADARTGSMSIVSAAPISDAGVVVVFVDLVTFGPSLANRFGGPDRLEFLMTTADGKTALSRSIDPAAWVGSDLAGTPFGTSTGVERPDVDGTQRLYGEATVAGTGWKIHAGADLATALAAASRLYHRELAIILGGLLAVLIAAIIVYRRIARPIHQLSGEVRAAAVGAHNEPVRASGPAEVVNLANDFNDLLDAVERELGERHRAEDAAQASEQSYRLLFEGNPVPMWILDDQSLRFLEVNQAAVEQYGYDRERFLAMRITDLLAPAGDADDDADDDRTRSDPEAIRDETRRRHQRADETVIEAQITSHTLTFEGRPARFEMAEDITAKERLEQHLNQSQRMESLGQLAGGVAHDFNNLLSVILNYAAFVSEEVGHATSNGNAEHWESVRADVQQIEHAADRAAQLVRQLLAFARREVVQTEVLDLNDVVVDLEEILRRTIGEHIELTVSLSPDLWPIVADSGRLAQVLINLSVNARDAMPDGGMLTIDTENVEVDEEYGAGRPGLASGSYVRLRVSDTGQGMDKEILDRAMEPFFTTKGEGTGTGLGLATVFGITKQAGGDVRLYSEPGLGTTVSVLLPASRDAVLPSDPGGASALNAGGETILLVEDEEALREVGERVLNRQGYRLLVAESGADAIRLAAEHDGRIDLLLTDVVMPEMSGKELAERLTIARPDIRVLFISGYAHPILGSTIGLDARVSLLEKPFSGSRLLSSVRAVLDENAEPSAGPA
jgi:PAS domain S-box-containing protein